MNPDTPKNPREELEVRVTALLMGELSDEEAAALREKIAADPALAALHARLGQVVGLLREASADAGGPASAEPLRFSPGRREQLLTHFKTVSARASAAARRDWRPFIQLGIAAALVALIGGAMMMPTFNASMKRGGVTMVLQDSQPTNDWAELASSTENLVIGLIKPTAPAPEAAAEAPALPAPDSSRWRWESQPGAIRGEKSVAEFQRGASADGEKPEAEAKRMVAYAERPVTLAKEAAKADRDHDAAITVTGTGDLALGNAPVPAAAPPTAPVLAFTPEAPAISEPLSTAGKVTLPPPAPRPQAGGVSGIAGGAGGAAVNRAGFEVAARKPDSNPEALKQLGALTAGVAGREVSQSEKLGELPALGTVFNKEPAAATPAPAAPSGPAPAGVTALGVTDGGLVTGARFATGGVRMGGEKAESRDSLERRESESYPVIDPRRAFAGRFDTDDPKKTAVEGFDAGAAQARAKTADATRNFDFGGVADSKARTKDWSGQVAPSEEATLALGDLLQNGSRLADKGKPAQSLEKKAKGLEDQMELGFGLAPAQQGQARGRRSIPLAEQQREEEVGRKMSEQVDGLAKIEEPALKQQEYYNKSISPEGRASVEQTKQLFTDADGFYQSGRHDLALKRTEQILNVDPYNIEVRKLQEKINKAVDKNGVTSYNETRSRLAQGVDAAWAMPARKFNEPDGLVEARINQARNIARNELEDRMGQAKKQLEEVKKLDEEIKNPALSEESKEEKTKQRGEKAAQLQAMDGEIREFQVSREKQLQEQSVRLRTAIVHDAPAQSTPAPQLVAADAGAAELSRSEMIQKKLERIIVPKIELKDATVAEALDFLKKKSVELDTTEQIAANRGINIVLKPDAGGTPSASAEAAPHNPSDARITLSLSNVPMSEAVRYVSSLAGLKYKVEPYAVAFAPAGAGADTVITKEFKVSPEIMKKAFTEAVRGGAEVTQHDVAKEFLAANGVAFGPLALAFYAPSDNKLIVRNTEEQLALIETIVATEVEKSEAAKTIAEEDKARTQKPAQPPTPQPEIATRANPFSTFSLNVTDVSFKLAEASLEKGQMPDAATVRSEEFINAFDYRDPEPAAGAPLAFASERARYPFAQNRDLLRLSVKTAAAGRAPGRALNVVLVLDASGSMERADRVNIVREALRVLASQMHAQDKLSVITFARTPRLWIDGVAGDKAGEATGRVGEIAPQGGTNIEAALDLGYATAKRHFQAGSINRVVLLTDGAANLGDVNPDALKQKVEAQRKQGIALDAFGVGWEGFDDPMLETLSRNGDGRYGFINTPEAAANEFAAQLAGALRVAASDVKVQVEFNPKRVTAYRQIGYAKHQLTKEQFRDNTVDAAEIGAAESGNALYACEVNPRGEGDIATVRVRFKVPGTSDYHEHEWTVPFTAPAPPLDQASPTLRLAGTASAFSEMLAGSPFATEVTSDALLGLINGVPAVFANDPRPQKLEWMIRQAKSISGK